jgi:hypothetical protein
MNADGSIVRNAGAPPSRTFVSTPAYSGTILAAGAVLALFETANVLFFVGLALIAYGVYGLARSRNRTRPRGSDGPAGSTPSTDSAGSRPGAQGRA